MFCDHCLGLTVGYLCQGAGGKFFTVHSLWSTVLQRYRELLLQPDGDLFDQQQGADVLPQSLRHHQPEPLPRLRPSVPGDNQRYQAAPQPLSRTLPSGGRSYGSTVWMTSSERELVVSITKQQIF
nr:uncharacterized protein LOC106684125 isoform X1 [Halyomorpha halys]